MNGNSLFVDTNILLYLLSGDKTLSNILDGKQIHVSFITELELLSFKNLSIREKSKIESLLRECIIVDINQSIKNKTISFRKKYSLKLPDSIIAATADYLNLPLLTSDSDFKKLEELSTLFYSN